MTGGFAHERPPQNREVIGLGSVEWYTPPVIFEALGLTFELDPASPVAGPVPWVPASRFITAAEDGLTAEWGGGAVWLNPPYDRQIHKWLARLMDHAAGGIALTFARTDTAWWQHAARAATAVCFVRRRVGFIPGEDHAAGKRLPSDRPGAGSCLIAFGRDHARALHRSGLGLTARLG